MAPEYKYREGPKAKEQFDKAMKRLFRAPKTLAVKQKATKKRKSSGGHGKG